MRSIPDPIIEIDWMPFEAFPEEKPLAVKY
jgi:hypothetical protein